MSKVEEAQGSALERKVTHPRIGAFEPKEDPEKEGIGMEEEHLWKTSLPPPPEREISPNKEDERKYGLVEAPVENKPPEKVLHKHADAFAWAHADMTGIPRFVAEHKLKTYPHIEPDDQRKTSIAPDRRIVVKEEVEE
ncbi:hypothetical protein Tco_1101388 [Tanacetum coccineum]